MPTRPGDRRPRLPLHTVEELAAHLEDIYLDAIRRGRSEADAQRAASAALNESSLRRCPSYAPVIPESRPVNDPPRAPA